MRVIWAILSPLKINHIILIKEGNYGTHISLHR